MTKGVNDRIFMSLTSTLFIPFIILIWVVYFNVPKRYQWCTIVIANSVFAITAGGIFSLLFMLFTAVTVYGYALRLYNMQLQLTTQLKRCSTRDEKKALKAKCTKRQLTGLWIVLGVNFGVWYSFKLMDRFGGLFKESHGFWMPLAMSFYTFIAAGYLIDVYHGKYAPQKNFLRFFAFMTYFPQMTEGPFTRYEDIKESLFGENRFSWERFEEGIFRIIWGYCKKLIIADTLWKSLNIILEDGFDIYAPSVLVLLFLLPLQQYMDFSGCMDIVLGVSHVMGIDLKENFKQPEFSRSVAEVWRRWHITLCQWFKDYVFYPIATSKTVVKIQKKLRAHHPNIAKYFGPVVAMFFVWTITGLWHGAVAKDLLWGWMNFVILASSFILEDTYKKMHEITKISAESRGWKIFSMIRTLVLFGIMETMADVSSASQAMRLYRSLLLLSAWRPQAGVDLLPEMTMSGAVSIAVFSAVVIYFDCRKEFFEAERSQLSITSLSTWQRMALFVLLFYCLIMLSSAGGGTGFAYAQF